MTAPAAAAWSIAERIAGANAAAGSGSAPWPRTTSSRITRDVRVGGLLGEQLEPDRRVDHRVRPAEGEGVVAEVDDDVPGTGQVREPPPAATGCQREVRTQRDVRPDRTGGVADHEHRLVGERAAAEQPAERARCRGRRGLRGPARPRGHGGADRGEHPLDARGDVRPPRAEQHGADGRLEPGDRRLDAVGDPGVRRLGDQDDVVRRGIPISSRSSAASVARPPTGPDRSRPPTPMTWDTRTPASSSRQVRCWAPVPDAATTPTAGPPVLPSETPARSTFRDPRATPPTIAVPQSGPITSTPARAAASARAISCWSGTLSENRNTCRPAATASMAGASAACPGVEIATSEASGAAAHAARTDRGAGGGGAVRCPSRAEGRRHRREGALDRRPVDGRDGDQQVVGARVGDVEARGRRPARGSAGWPSRSAPRSPRPPRRRPGRRGERDGVVVLAGPHRDVPDRVGHRCPSAETFAAIGTAAAGSGAAIGTAAALAPAPPSAPRRPASGTARWPGPRRSCGRYAAGRRRAWSGTAGCPGPVECSALTSRIISPAACPRAASRTRSAEKAVVGSPRPPVERGADPARQRAAAGGVQPHEGTGDHVVAGRGQSRPEAHDRQRGRRPPGRVDAGIDPADAAEGVRGQPAGGADDPRHGQPHRRRVRPYGRHR